MEREGKKGKKESERDTTGDPLGLMVLASGCQRLTHMRARTHPPTHTLTSLPPHASQVVPAYIHGLALLLFG